MVTNVPGAKAYRLIQQSDDGDGDDGDDDGAADDDGGGEYGYECTGSASVPGDSTS